MALSSNLIAVPRVVIVVAALAVAAAVIFSQASLSAQYPNYGDSGQGGGRPIDSPQTDLTPIGPPAVSPGGYGSGPMFDPYATGTPIGGGGAMLGAPVVPTGPPPAGGSGYPSGSFFGQLFGGGGGASTFPGGSLSAGPTILSPPGQQAPAPMIPPAGGYGQPYGGSIYGGQTYGGPSFAPPPPSGGAYPTTIYPQGSPSTLFPGGLFGGAGIGGVFAQDPNLYNIPRFFQGTRLRHSYIGGGSGNKEVEKNQTDVSVAVAFQNFLYCGRPLYVVPSFSLHLWDGPVSPGGASDPDLPSAVYDGFLDFGWQTDPNQMFGGEFGLRVGVFTDFDVMNSDSLRIRGKALGSFRLTPASTLKAGIYYLDRNSIQLLPAGGLLWQPSPVTRFDIFFPEPKLANYWRTIGTQDVWWYIAGDYGGGAWTIQRADGTDDNVEMNEIRATFGLEWGRSELIRTGRRRAFVEIGYVFDREVNYLGNPADDFSPEDAFMIRGGFGY